MYVFKSPIQKKNNYICNLDKKISLNLNDIKIKNIQKTTNLKSYILTCYINKKINKSEIDTIKNIDTEAYNSIITNDDWFEDKLEVDEVNKLYINSYNNDDNIINIILPTDIFINISINNNNDNIDNLLSILKDFNNLKKYIIDISISHCGLYFYSKNCINKWIIKQININNINDDDNMILNREDIEIEWEQDIYKINDIIDEKIIELNILKEKINILFNEIKKLEKSDNIWENKLNELKYIIQNSNNRILSIYDNR